MLEVTNTRTVSPYRFVIGGLSLWANFAAGLSFQAVSPILPIITDDYGISYTNAGLLVGVIFIIQGAFGIPGGIIVGRLGIRKIYTVCWFLMGLLTLSALSPNFEELLALRVVYGLGTAILIPATVPLIMQWFRPRELPIITSLNIACFSLGIVVSVSTVAPLSDALGWQRVMGLFGAIALAGGFAWLVWGKAGDDTRSKAQPPAWGDIWAVLRNRTVLLLGFADTACFSFYMALSGWLPTFYNESRGMSLTEAGFVISLLPFAGIFAVLLGGLLTLKIRQKQLFLIVPGIMVGVGGLGSFLIDNTAITYVSVIVLGLGSWLYIPMLMTLPMGLPGMTPAKVAIAWGWVMTVSGIGTFIAPLVVGAMKDVFDTFIPGFLVFSVLAWFLLVAGFMLPKSQDKDAQLRSSSTSSTPVTDSPPP